MQDIKGLSEDALVRQFVRTLYLSLNFPINLKLLPSKPINF